jgi:hypothetical protein
MGAPKLVKYRVEDCGYESPCWVWILAIDRDGYARVTVNRKPSRAARVYYEQAKGPIPEGLVVDHLCRVRSCVNPEHLEAVTHAVNVQRGAAGPREICRHGHPYDEENTYISPAGTRHCRTCRNLASNRKYHRQRAKALAASEPREAA